MKRLSIFCVLFIFSIAIFFSACETDFDIAADWKEITIVYGILNPTEANHFIRIQKAFLDEETSALQIAEVNDSLFHQQILSVTLNEKVGVEILNTHTLQKVNGEDFGIIKEEGAFANSPNILYHTDAVLNTSSTYQLIIENTDAGIISAETPLIEEIRIIKPNGSDLEPDINLVSATDYSILWSYDQDAYLYDLIFRIFYSEITLDGTENKQFDWKLARNKVYTTNPLKENLSKQEFFQAIADNVGPEDQFIDRQIDSFQFHIFAGAESLNTYNQVLIAQQTSIAAGQGNDPYTNITNGGFGLFSSRYTQVVYGLELSNLTKDSLVCNPLTKDLNFLQASVSQINCD